MRFAGRQPVHLSMVFMALFVTTALAELPVVPKGKGDSCVAPVDQMRREHMDLLNHQRDLTVIDGVRSKQFSLKGCIDCHVQQYDNDNPIPINDDGQFCQACHSYVSVKIDCFECHRTTPDSQLPSSAANNHTPFPTQQNSLIADIQRYLNLARPID